MMRCPDCGAFAVYVRAKSHMNGIVHRFGPEIRSRLKQGQPVKQICEELGIGTRRMRSIFKKLGITKGMKKHKDIRGPRAAVPPQLEALAAKLEALGFVVEAAVLKSRGRIKANKNRLYINGRRCAIGTAKEYPKNFEDEAPVVRVKAPPSMDWDFFLCSTSIGWLVLSKGEMPPAQIKATISSGFRPPRTLNLRARLEAWKKIKSIGRPAATSVAMPAQEEAGASLQEPGVTERDQSVLSEPELRAEQLPDQVRSE